MNNLIITRLVEICGGQNLILQPELMPAYTIGWRGRYAGTALAVVFPTNTAQIQAIVNVCREMQIVIVPQGGNTSTCGGSIPLADYHKPQIVVNLVRMNKIISLDEQNFSIHVEAGVTLGQVRTYAKKYNLNFPLSIASEDSCQIGGNIATNAGGIHVLKYGMMRNLTLGLKAITADGKVIDALSSLYKNNSYLDLKQLFIGSEGTLGIISEAVLKLYPLPHNFCTLLIGIDNLNSAIKLLNQLRQTYTNNVSAFEIIKSDSQQIYKQSFPDSPLPFEAEWLLLAEIESGIDFNLDILAQCLTDCGCNLSDSIITSSEQERRQLWQFREHIPLAEKAYGYAAKHDISLPMSKIEAFLEMNMPKLKQIAPNGYFSIFGHLGDGNLHYNFGIHNASHEEIHNFEKLVSPIVYEDVIKFKGSIAAEHGIGQSKMLWLKKFSHENNYLLFKEIKQLMDPEGLFNPKKILKM